VINKANVKVTVPAKRLFHILFAKSLHFILLAKLNDSLRL